MRETVDGLWIPANVPATNIRRTDDSCRPIRGIASGLLWSLALWAGAAVAALAVLS